MELKYSTSNILTLNTQFDELTMGIAARDSNNHIDYTQNLDNIRKQEKDLLHSVTSITPKNIIFLYQVHEDSIIIIDKEPGEDIISAGEADCLITNRSDTCLVIRTADCVPVFAYDPVNNIIGAAHSGWRSTELEISKKMILKMNETYKSHFNDIMIFILPSIGPETYEVNMDVASRFPGFYQSKEESIFLDLWSIIEHSLIETGITEKNIFNSRTCNLIEKEKFFSHRGGDKGRNLNFIYTR